MTPMIEPHPPAWAEAILRLSLKRADRESVTGDLLEEYREVIHAGRDRVSAGYWYVRQVPGFLWRAHGTVAVLLVLLSVGRFALDIFVPPASFHARSAVTTYSHIALFMTIGFRGAWRGRTAADAIAAVLGAQMLAVPMIFVSTAAFLAVWHDPDTLAAIRHTGGFGELFILPVLFTWPAAFFGMVGGGAGLALRKLR